MFVVDFMGLVRKIPIKKQKLETFEDLAKTIFSMIVSYAKGASRIDIVLDMYNNETTIKAQERLARGMHHVNLASISHKQKVLEDMALF